MNYPRINQYRHMFAAGRSAVFAAAAAVLSALLCGIAVLAFVGLLAAGAYAAAISVLLCVGLASAMLMLAARAAFRAVRVDVEVSRRNRIGADSEDYVNGVLDSAALRGWRRRSSLDWPGVGDLDNALISPDGLVAVVVETKTRHFTVGHLARVYAQASWLCRRHSCAAGAIPVLVPARERHLERFHDGVLIVSPDLLVPALQGAHRAALACSGGAS
jgi:hypothetical protein